MADRKAVFATSPRGDGKKDWWTRVGSAFVNRDGSMTLMLDALPTNGRLIVQDEKERDDRGGGGGGGGRRDDDDPFEPRR